MNRRLDTYEVLTLEAREPSGNRELSEGLFGHGGGHALDAAATHRLDIFLFGFLKDARRAAQLAATTGSLQASRTGPGGGAGQVSSGRRAAQDRNGHSLRLHSGSCLCGTQCTRARRASGCGPAGAGAAGHGASPSAVAALAAGAGRACRGRCRCCCWSTSRSCDAAWRGGLRAGCSRSRRWATSTSQRGKDGSNGPRPSLARPLSSASAVCIRGKTQNESRRPATGPRDHLTTLPQLQFSPSPHAFGNFSALAPPRDTAALTQPSHLLLRAPLRGILEAPQKPIQKQTKSSRFVLSCSSRFCLGRAVLSLRSPRLPHLASSSKLFA